MTLSDLAAFGSFVSGIAVVITLVMLLLQMRQVDRNQRAAMQLGRATRGTDLLTQIIDPEVSRIYRKAVTSSEPLAGTELFVWQFYTITMFFNWEDSFLQHRAGLLDKASMESEEAIIRGQMRSPAVRTNWEFGRGTWGRAFTDYIDQIIADVPLIRPVDTDRFYQAVYNDLLSKARSLAPGTAEQMIAEYQSLLDKQP